jgi:histidinol-phosphatase
VELVRGEIDGFLVECCHLWDHAPWILLVEEAGGRFTDRSGGRRGDRGGGLYSNANVHTQLLRRIGYPGHP